MSDLGEKQASPLKLALSTRVIARSAVVAVVVGTALNLINQGDAIFAGAALNLSKLVLTYVVPFTVSTYGAWSMATAMHRKSDIGP